MLCVINSIFLSLQDNRILQGTHNAARRFLDGINYVTDSIVSVSAKPTKAVSMWLTDQIAPPYWVPNAKITVSFKLVSKG